MKYKSSDIVQMAVILLLCAAMAVLDLTKTKLHYTADEVNNRLIADTVPLIIGSAAVVWLMIRGRSKLFGRPQRLLYLLPCLIVAVDNFPFHAYFAGLAEVVYTGADKWILFALYCAFVGVFEECVFRGILFPLMAGSFSSDKKGFLKTYFLSSVVFGVMHLFNIFGGAGVGPTLLQVGYTTLTGGLFAFVLIKTKNVLLCALVHGVYDFCGLLLSAQGLGIGSAFDWQTTVTMAVVGVAAGIFVLYSVFKYSESERTELYEKLGFGVRPTLGKDEETNASGDAEKSNK